ncbi:FAD-linked oxidoreductase apf9 [Pseudocercospora fuligena]|uniref:FAD-linked oxidoreductase apf9 n=1 Tax=Pseudocercospora fuligena TaxID=685502 RepID=A0A8H6VQ85_9PEZI|nr:FAD-linked oxidoreductase apf9 [Pseudocercospora fuligena]
MMYKQCAFWKPGLLAALGAVTVFLALTCEQPSTMVYRKVATMLLLSGLSQSTIAKCRCIPKQPCWPSVTEWEAFNRTIHGKLFVNIPVAIPCYEGPLQNAAECASVTKQYANNSFQQTFPIGYSYPLQPDCPLIPFGAEADSKCGLGDAPIYTVNATEIEHIQSAVIWARSANIRLVIRDTGHDLLGRSMGYGSLQVWIKYLRNGIEYHAQFDQGSHQKSTTSWKGLAFTIRGGYTWSDIYFKAARRDLFVVGGGTPSVGYIGGWMQGGGHGPATHDFGLGADNVLSAKVVLADGTLVTASPVENKDLFFAIRGGGPGTYGIVVETTVKAYPTQKVLAQTLAIASQSGNITSFLEAVADLYQAFPELAEAGWSGYGSALPMARLASTNNLIRHLV